jgi:dolichol kinase
LVTAVSRSGNRSEVLQGPFYYVLALLAATLLSWRGSPVGVIALCQMAVGDGVADIVGRRLGAGNRWPVAPTKSVIGSAAFVTGAAAASLGILSWLQLWGCMGPLPADCATRILAISIACAAVELLPASLCDDNITVPLLAAALAIVLFGSGA